MIGVLDTHTFVWWDSEPSKLSPKAATFLQDRTNRALVSVVSVWEILIKAQLGKMKLSSPIEDILTRQQANGVGILSLTLQHVLALAQLPMSHKDPFDRILAAQANVEGAVLLSADPIFAQYPVNLLW